MENYYICKRKLKTETYFKMIRLLFDEDQKSIIREFNNNSLGDYIV